MAGSLEIVISNHHQQTITIDDQWQVRFARYFPYPSLSSTSQFLVALPDNRRYKSNGGTWITSSSSTASLRIVKDDSSSNAILSLNYHGKFLEEHYVSKLNFSWPQVSCVSGFPARGSRVVFVNYEDSTRQKFAVKFSTIHEAESFISAVKGFLGLFEENLKGFKQAKPRKSKSASVVSSQSEFMDSNVLPPRGCEEELAPFETYVPQMPMGLDYEVEQPSCTQGTIINDKPEDSLSALPPSFATLLSSCFLETGKQDTNPETSAVSQEDDFKLQIVKYMKDSSFQDMLVQVDKIVNEIEGFVVAIFLLDVISFGIPRTHLITDPLVFLH